MAHWLQCSISAGQFTDEYVVEARDFQGNVFSLFAPTEFVECDEEPIPGSNASGWLRVEKLEQTGELVLVLLPRTPLENGATVTVRASQLKFRQARELA